MFFDACCRRRCVFLCLFFLSTNFIVHPSSKAFSFSVFCFSPEDEGQDSPGRLALQRARLLARLSPVGPARDGRRGQGRQGARKIDNDDDDGKKKRKMMHRVDRFLFLFSSCLKRRGFRILLFLFSLSCRSCVCFLVTGSRKRKREKPRLLMFSPFFSFLRRFAMQSFLFRKTQTTALSTFLYFNLDHDNNNKKKNSFGASTSPTTAPPRSATRDPPEAMAEAEEEVAAEDPEAAAAGSWARRRPSTRGASTACASPPRGHAWRREGTAASCTCGEGSGPARITRRSARKGTSGASSAC